MNDIINLEQKKVLLKKQACFSQFTEEEIDVLADLLVATHFAAGETIVTECDLVVSVYFIVSGKASVRHVTIKEDHTHNIECVATLSAGETIGLNETGFYSVSGVRTATVVAIDDMVLLQLSVAEFHGFSLVYSHVNEVMRKSAETFLDITDGGFHL